MSQAVLIHVAGIGDVEIDVAADGDAASLAELHKQMRDDRPSWPSLPADAYRAMISKSQVDPTVFFVVARDGSKRILSSLEIANWGAPTTVLEACKLTQWRILQSMAVAPEIRSKGLGGRVLEYALLRAAERCIGAQAVLLDTDTPGGERFYLRHGFRFVETIGSKRHFVRDLASVRAHSD